MSPVFLFPFRQLSDAQMTQNEEKGKGVGIIKRCLSLSIVYMSVWQQEKEDEEKWERGRRGGGGGGNCRQTKSFCCLSAK